MGKFYEGLESELKLYARQAAWLNAPQKGSNTARIERMEADGQVPDLPQCAAMHMIGYLYEVGPMMQSGPVTHGEIESWSRNTARTLSPWEARTIRALSVAYVTEHFAAADPSRPAPYQRQEPVEQNRKAVERQVKNAMAAYFAAKGKK